MRFSKKAVISILVFLLIFTIAMCVMFIVTGSAPDTLISEVFNFCAWEAGALGAIKVAGTVKGEKKDHYMEESE